MAHKQRTKRLLIVAALLVAVGIVALLLLPYWMGAPLRLAARQAGLSYENYERDGYGRFALTEVGYTNREVAFSAGRVEAPAPLPWLFQRGTPEANDAPALRLSGWQLIYTPSGKGGGTSVYTNVQQVLQLVETVQRQIPAAELTSGTVVVSQVKLRIPRLEWQGGKTRVEAVHDTLQHNAVLTADFSEAPVALKLQSDSLHIFAELNLRTNASGLEVAGPVTWLTNRADTKVAFSRGARLPDYALVQAESVMVPPEVTGLSGYQPVTGNAQFTWQSNEYRLALHAEGTPKQDRSRLPPVVVNLEGEGDLGGATIQTAVISSPSLQFKLEMPARVRYQAPFLEETVQTTFAGDLSKQTFLRLLGKIQGNAQISPGTNAYPEAQFALTATAPGVPEFQAERVEVTGHLNYPNLELEKTEATLPGGGQVSAQANINLQRQSLTSATIVFAGALPPDLLPQGLRVDGAFASVEASGAFTNISHGGHLQITNVLVPNLRPLSIEATWQGTHASQATWNVAVASSNVSLKVAGDITRPRLETLTARIDHLSLTQAQEVLLRQTGSVQLSFSTDKANGVSVLMDGLNLAGQAGEIRAGANVQWPHQGALELRAGNLTSALPACFLASPPPPFEIHLVDAAARWTNGPVFGQVIVNGSTVLQSNAPGAHLPVLREAISLRVHAEASESAVRLRDAALAGPAGPIAALSGEVPATITPGGTNLVSWHRSGQFQGSFFAEPNSVLWDELSRRTGFKVRLPALSARVSGTPEAPEGSLSFRCPELRLTDATNAPTFTDIVLEADVDGQGARLEVVSFKVRDQLVGLTGHLPWDENLFAQIESKRLPAWTNATAHLKVPNAQLAAAAESFPTLLRPEGSLNADIQLSPGGKLGGVLVIEGAQLKPLPSIGRIGDIEVRVKFAEQTATIEHARAALSGAEVRLTGEADLTPGDWLRELIPPMVVRVRGTNVPLSRTADLILRSDVDLVVRRTNGAPPLIAGEAQLRNSYLLSDLGRMVGGNLAGPQQRAPYFSIDDPVLGEWRLDLRVTGEQFLKVRTPVFNGQASANMRLGGTLSEPVAIGEVTIDSGLVRFPFASLRIVQGRATLTSQNPYEPQLAVSAASRQFGYDIRMEATGPASSPILQFSSTPPLSSERIVLMITAGQLPGPQQVVSTQQRAQAFALFLGRDVLSRLGIGDESEQRLTVQSGEQISEQGSPTYLVEYKLSDDWFLVGEYDRFDELNVGVRWRVYSK